MRHLKAALVGLVAGVLLTAAVLVVQVLYIDQLMAAQMADCGADLNASAGVCFDYVQFREWMVPVAFAIGFIGAFFWFLRRQDRLLA